MKVKKFNLKKKEEQIQPNCKVWFGLAWHQAT
jgi:hypothetical protein